MPESKHAARGSRKGWLIGLAVVALVAGILYWSLDTVLGDEETKGEAIPSPSSNGEDSPSAAAPDPELEAAFTRCADDLSAADGVLAAAEVGIRHWHEHVQARTDALAGRIPVAEMNRIFDRTRLGGPRDQDRYHSAEERYDGTLRCDFPEQVADGQKDAAQACVVRARAVERALSTGDQAMDDWESHLEKMAMFRHGGMSAHRAQHLWVVAWRTAPVNIRAYQRAASALEGLPACKPAPA